MVDQITWLARVLTSADGISVICLAILFWAAYVYYSFRSRIRPILRGAQNALSEITKYQNTTEFAERFDEFSLTIEANPILKHAWSEFDETLIKDPKLEPLAIRNTRVAGDYFHRGSIIGDRMNLRFYSAFPNLLTGTGILGTFVGLVAGIWLSSKGLGAADTEVMRQALQNLLDGASLAFTTSICGLLSSIIFSWREKHWIHALDGYVRSWNDELDARVERVTSENLASLQLKQSKQQTEILTQFTTDLAFQIADAFQDRISETLAPTLTQLVDGVEALRGDLGRRSDDALEAMVASFSETLTSSAGKELSALGETLNSLNDKLTDQIDNMVLRQQQIGDASSKSAKDMATAVDTSLGQMQTGVEVLLKEMTKRVAGMVGDIGGEMRDSAAEVSKRLAELTDHLNDSIEKVRQSMRDTAQATTSYKEILNKTGEVVTDLGDVAGTVGNIVGPMNEAVSNIGEVATVMEGISGRNEEVAKDIASSINDMGVVHTTTQELWARYDDRFADIDKSLSKTMQEIVGGVENYTDRVRQFVESLDKHTASIVSDLAGANSELTDAVEDLSDTLNRNVG
jgi:methyl-accepting chemotaxis protein